MGFKRALHELRSALRYPTNLAGHVLVGSHREEVTIQDISAGGAKIRCHAVLPLYAKMTLETGARHLDARVVWRDGTTYGLRFMHEIAPLELVRQVHPALRLIYGTDRRRPASSE